MNNIQIFNLRSETGFCVDVLSLGGIITKIMAKDHHGLRQNVVLKYEDYADYYNNSLFLGCITGPIAGRTKNGQIHVNNIIMNLDTSCHPNSLHCCNEGLHLINWRPISQSDTHVTLETESTNYGATVSYQITYRLEAEILTLETYVTTSQPIYLSITNHSYFNLTGDAGLTIDNHLLKLNATHVASLDHECLPLSLEPIETTLYDFTHARTINAKSVAIDHPFKLSNGLRVAELKEPISRRQMTIKTTQPYMVIYTGNFLESYTSKSGKLFKNHTGICFETQDLPNITNNNLDQVAVVTPKKPYNHSTSFEFTTY